MTRSKEKEKKNRNDKEITETWTEFWLPLELLVPSTYNLRTILLDLGKFVG